VEVPASPWAANSATAASSTSSRRSAAGIRCLVIVMETKLVTTHYFVKRDAARIVGPGPDTFTAARPKAGARPRAASHNSRPACRRAG